MNTQPTPNNQPRPANQLPQHSPSGQPVATIDPVKLLNKHKWTLAIAVVAGGVLGFATHLAWMRIAPQWKPYALFNALPPSGGVRESLVGVANEVEMNRFMQTQARVMVSDAVLNSVAEDPALQGAAPNYTKRFVLLDKSAGENRFNPTECVKELKEDLAARTYPNTTLIELSMTYKDKNEATGIVQLVREKYESLIRQQGQARQDDRTKSLRQTIDGIDKQIGTLQNRRENIISQKSMDTLDDRNDATRVALTQVNDEFIRVTQDFQGLTKQKEQMEAELNNPAGSQFGDEMRGLVERDQVITSLKGDVAQLEGALQGLLTLGYKPDHRECLRLQAAIDGAKQNLEDQRAQRLRKIFDEQLDSIRKTLEQRQAQAQDLLAKKAEYETRLTDMTKTLGQISDIDRQINGLLESKSLNQRDLQAIEAYAALETANRVELLQKERPPSLPAFPKWEFLVPAGIALCTGLVGAGILVKELVDDRVKGPSDIAIIPRTRILGIVPDAAEDPAGQGAAETSFRDRPKGIVAESFRTIRSTIARRAAAADHRTYAIVAAMPGSGATSVVSNLALAFATADKKVLVIDANFRRPSLHRVFGLQEGTGLADVLGKTRDLASVIQATSTPNLDLIAAGSKEQRVFERLATESMGEVLAKLRTMYDVILIDVAPAVVSGDALSLAARVDASILVVRAMREKRGMVARIRNDLADSRAEFLGVLVNGVKASVGGYMKTNIQAAHEYQSS